MRYVAVGGSKRQPLARGAAGDVLPFAPHFGRSCGWVQRGIGIDRQTIVVWIMRKESRPRLGLTLILLEGQRQSSVSEMQPGLGFCNRRKRSGGIRKLDRNL